MIVASLHSNKNASKTPDLFASLGLGITEQTGTYIKKDAYLERSCLCCASSKIKTYISPLPSRRQVQAVSWSYFVVASWSSTVAERDSIRL